MTAATPNEPNPARLVVAALMPMNGGGGRGFGALMGQIKARDLVLKPGLQVKKRGRVGCSWI
jgi:hypothetical protein